MPPVHIEQGNWPTDPAFLDALRLSWIEQYAQYIGHTSASELIARMHRSGELHDGSEQPLFVASTHGQVIGIAGQRALTGLSLITMLEVLPSMRQQGVGAALLAAMLEAAEQPLMAHVSIHRPRVLSFYLHKGFRLLPRTFVDHLGYSLEFDVVAHSLDKAG